MNLVINKLAEAKMFAVQVQIRKHRLQIFNYCTVMFLCFRVVRIEMLYPRFNLPILTCY